MRLYFTISLFICGAFLGLKAQDNASLVMPSKKSDFSLGIDAFGAVLTPVVSSVGKKGTVVFRPSVEGQWQFSDYFYFGLAGEVNQIRYDDLGNNYTKYRMSGFAVKPSIVFHKRDGKFFVGLGFITGRQTEEGIIEIPGQYFGNYTEYQKFSLNLNGWNAKIGFDIKLKEQLSLKLELNHVMLIGNESFGDEGDSIRKSEFMVGSNRLSNANNTMISISIRSFCYLVYRF